MKKKLLFVLMLIAAVVLMPKVQAITLGSISNITNTDTLPNTSSCSFNLQSDNSVATFTCNTASFNLLDVDNSVNRPEGYAWIGFRVVKPTGVETINYSVSFNGQDAGQSMNCSNGSCDDYIGFNEDNLKVAVKNNTKVVLSYVITWTDGNGESATQTINVVIDPEGIILKEHDQTLTEVWNNAEYQAEVADVMSKLYNDLDATISVAKGMDTSKYTDESVKALEAAIAEAEAAGKDLTTNNQAAVIALRNAITNAITNLVVKGDEPVTPGSTTTDTNKPGEQAPDTFDAGLTYVGLALSAIGASVVSIKKLRNN